MSRDERDNQTPSRTYPSVTTDQFVGLGPARSNQPYSFTQDRIKLSADHRGFGTWKFGIGADHDARERSLQAVDTTRETTLWGRVGVQALDNIALALKLAHADRSASEYRVVGSLLPPDNPLMRKFNIADRQRDSAALRADFAVTESVSLGLSAQMSYDDYKRSTIGLIDARTIHAGADLSAALSEQTQVHAFAQLERVRSRQAGSQAFAGPDWKGRSKDIADVAGVGLKHSALKGQLELGADFVVSRSRSEVSVDAGVSAPPFPDATTSTDSLKLHATYRINDNMSLLGSYWYEQVEARDWRFDGVQADTISNLLAFGEQAPRYAVNVIRIALRYRF